jgi:hypothetical protein
LKQTYYALLFNLSHATKFNYLRGGCSNSNEERIYLWCCIHELDCQPLSDKISGVALLAGHSAGGFFFANCKRSQSSDTPMDDIKEIPINTNKMNIKRSSTTTKPKRRTEFAAHA